MRQRRLAISTAVGVIVAVARLAGAQQYSIYGGPTYNSATQTGYLAPAYVAGGDEGPGILAGAGFGIAQENYYSNGTVEVANAFYLSPSGAAEMSNLGTDGNGNSYMYAEAINANGVIVGGGKQYVSGAVVAAQAVRWASSGAAATVLGSIGTGSPNALPVAVNNSGSAAGSGELFSGSTFLGNRGVLWSGSGTAATQLGTLGTDTTGYGNAGALAINDAGSVVGWSDKYQFDSADDDDDIGERAVIWNAGTTTATELGNLGTVSYNGTNLGYTESQASTLNASGTVVGWAQKYTQQSNMGIRAVRWAAGGTAASELGNLGTDSSGNTTSYPYAINAAGTAVGYAEKYSGGTDVGPRAVLWSASGTAATELGNLGTSSSGYTDSYALAINATGTAVGYAEEYSGGIDLGQQAVLWNSNGSAVNLNTLLPANSGWNLFEALSISDTGWAVGIGTYDPGGSGTSYDRYFLMQVTPEPASLALLGATSCGLLLRRRQPR